MSDPIVRTRTYYGVFATLIVLTFLSVGSSFLEIGEWHVAVATGFAVVKATLVALVFMHLYFGHPLNWLVFAGGFFWLAILILLTLCDYATRSWLTL